MNQLEAMALSAIVEAGVAYGIARRRGWAGRRPSHVALASAAATLITHPQLWAAALWAYEWFPFWPSVLALESLVVLIEGGLIAWIAALRIDRAMIVSLAANSASLLVGLAIVEWSEVSARIRMGISIQA